MPANRATTAAALANFCNIRVLLVRPAPGRPRPREETSGHGPSYEKQKGRRRKYRRPRRGRRCSLGVRLLLLLTAPETHAGHFLVIPRALGGDGDRRFLPLDPLQELLE